MNEPDVVLTGLARLPLEAPSAALSRQIRAASLARLVPAKVHPAWRVAVAATVVAYLGWALIYTGLLG